MKKKNLFIIFIFAIALSGIFLIGTNFLSSRLIVEIFDDNLNVSLQKQAETITKLIRNDLISGNYKSAEVILVRSVSPLNFFRIEVQSDDSSYKYSTESESKENQDKIEKKVYFSENGKIWGTVYYFFDKGSLLEKTKELYTIQIKTVFVASLFSILVITLTIYLLGVTSLKIDRFILDLDGVERVNFFEKIFWSNLIEKIIAANRQNINLNKKLLISEKTNYLASLAKQVAHDIRSPLSALNMVASTLESVPEEKRLIIRNATQRINDIANNLLQQSKSGSNLNLESKNSTTHQMANTHENIDQLKVSDSFEGISVVRNKASEPTMLVSVIDLIVSEKRTQYRNRMNLQIEAHLNQGYGLFSAVSNSDLARVLSNLINNSVEAIADRGSVVLNLQSKNDRAILTIQDDGVGIPDDILASLGKSVISHGKNQIDSGTGLGVLSATQFLQSIGGTIKYFSKLQQGTLVEITLPLCKSPAWFQEKIVFSSRSLLVTIDDDQTIHQIWSGRIKSAFTADTNIQHLVFSQLSTARDWISKMRKDDPDLFSRAIFLVDFEFVGSNENGLDFILSENIQDQSILVTSRFEEVSIRDKLISHNVKMIPKNLSPFVALSIAT